MAMHSTGEPTHRYYTLLDSFLTAGGISGCFCTHKFPSKPTEKAPEMLNRASALAAANKTGRNRVSVPVTTDPCKFDPANLEQYLDLPQERMRLEEITVMGEEGRLHWISSQGSAKLLAGGCSGFLRDMAFKYNLPIYLLDPEKFLDNGDTVVIKATARRLVTTAPLPAQNTYRVTKEWARATPEKGNQYPGDRETEADDVIYVKSVKPPTTDGAQVTVKTEITKESNPGEQESDDVVFVKSVESPRTVHKAQGVTHQGTVVSKPSLNKEDQWIETYGKDIVAAQKPSQKITPFHPRAEAEVELLDGAETCTRTTEYKKRKTEDMDRDPSIARLDDSPHEMDMNTGFQAWM